MFIQSIKNQAGPAQDTWPPKPVRPRTLGPQAKTKPVRPRTLGPPSQTPAGPAQDPWPPSQTQAGPVQDPWPPKPKPSRSGPGPSAPKAEPKPVRPRTLGPWRGSAACVDSVFACDGYESNSKNDIKFQKIQGVVSICSAGAPSTTLF